MSQDVVKVDGLDGDLERFNGVYKIFAGMMNDDAPVWRTVEAVADPDAPDGEPFYPQNRVGRGWGIRNSAMGAVRLPKILVLTIDDFVSAQTPIISTSIVMQTNTGGQWATRMMWKATQET